MFDLLPQVWVLITVTASFQYFCGTSVFKNLRGLSLPANLVGILSNFVFTASTSTSLPILCLTSYPSKEMQYRMCVST